MRAYPLILCFIAAQTVGCFLTPGAPDDSELLDGPFAELEAGELAVFLRGDEQFGRRFTFSEGLGPVFNADSCATCHPADGRGHPEFGFKRFGRADGSNFDPLVSLGGPQLQDRAAPAASPEVVPEEATGVTMLLAPSVTGLGLLEAVPDAEILALADPDDDDGDGISGRVHWRAPDATIAEFVAEAAAADRYMLHPEGVIGRFGRRASNVSLLHQAVSAYHQDMGVTSDFATQDLVSAEGTGARDAAADPEVGSGELSDVVFYLRTLRPPARRAPDSPEALAGEEVFAQVGCSSCHVPTLRTGESSVAVLDNVEFHPYTDLLLHDMGEYLADGYAEHGSAVGEWRTPPLWGLGLAADFTGGELFLLHDGRARSIDDAIRLHDGEAAASRDAWANAPQQERDQLRAFLESL